MFIDSLKKYVYIWEFSVKANVFEFVMLMWTVVFNWLPQINCQKHCTIVIALFLISKCLLIVKKMKEKNYNMDVYMKIVLKAILFEFVICYFEVNFLTVLCAT